MDYDYNYQTKRTIEHDVQKYLFERYLDINKLNKHNIINTIKMLKIQHKVLFPLKPEYSPFYGEENYQKMEDILGSLRDDKTQDEEDRYKQELGVNMFEFIKRLLWYKIIPISDEKINFNTEVHKYTYTNYLQKFPFKDRSPKEEIAIVKEYMNMDIDSDKYKSLNIIYSYFSLESVPDRGNIYEYMIRDIYVAYLCRHVDAKINICLFPKCQERERQYGPIVLRYRAKILPNALEAMYRYGPGERHLFKNIAEFAGISSDSDSDSDPIHPNLGFTRRKSARKSARKSVRKSRKSVRKSVRKSRKSARKSVRKSRKSARKSVRKSRRKSVRKSRKSARKSRRKSVRK